MDTCEVATGQIAAEEIDFTGSNPEPPDLAGASAVAAKLSSMKLEWIIWREGDFSRAQCANILWCRFKKSVLNKSIWTSTYAQLSGLSGATMNNVGFQKAKFDGTLINRLKTDQPALQTLIRKGILTVTQFHQHFPRQHFPANSIPAAFVQYARDELTETVHCFLFEYTTPPQRVRPPRSVQPASKGQSVQTNSVSPL